VRIELTEALAAVPAFSVQAPPRVRHRPAGRVGNALGRNNVEINQGNLRSVSVARPVNVRAWCST
jgi:type IV pilus assembly protein PilQ